jgi:2-polyprenyl-3-methyl-5-hydroxy-6-metoxy-1,4-benzoquinol methylase
MTTIELDQAKVESFGAQITDTVNKAMVTLGLSVGHRTGLFDTLAAMSWATSQDIARRSGLQERYIREWLAAMVTGRIMEYRAIDQTYRLPAEHAAFTTSAAGANNIAGYATFVALMADVETDIVEAFRTGGGVSYDRYTRFQELMAANSGEVFDHALVPGILPVVPGLVEQLQAGIEVADIGCGSGHAINVMARAFPRSRFTGYDFSAEGVARGTQEAVDWGLTNARFEQVDVAKLNVTGRFDVITAFDAIHDQAQPRKVLANIHSALKPGGTFLMADIAGSSNLEDNLAHPMAPWLYTVSLFHCMTVSLALDGEGLGTMWGEQKARELLSEAGFHSVEVRQLEGDPLNSYFISRK